LAKYGTPGFYIEPRGTLFLRVFELYNIESGCEKIAKELKIPILTIGAIIKKL